MNIYDKIVDIFGGYANSPITFDNFSSDYGKVYTINRDDDVVLVEGYITKKELEELGRMCDYEISSHVSWVKIEIIEVY